jgi:hypothetical protein
MALRLKPSNDEEPRKQGGHQLTEIGSHRRMGPEKTRLSQQFKHNISIS